MAKKKIIIFLVLLTVIAFFLRVLPFGYGLAPIYFSDTFLFSNALNLANGIAHHDFSQLKEVSYYPYFSSFILLFIFGLFYLIGTLGGLFSSAAEFIRYSVLQMDQLFEMSRIMIAVLGTLLIPLVYLATRRIVSMGRKKWIESGAVLSAFLICFSLLHIHYSHTVRPHIAVAFTLFLSFYAYLMLLKKQNLFSYIFLGVIAGFAAGTLHNGFLAILFLIMAHFFVRSQQKNKKIFSRPFVMALVIFFLIVFVCWPYLFLNPKGTLGLNNEKFSITLRGEKEDLGGSFNGQGFIIDSRGLILSETSLIFLLILFLIIYFVSLKKKRWEENPEKSPAYKAAIKGGLLVFAIHFLVFGIYGVASYKFLLPLIPFLCVFAGVLFSRSLELISQKHRPWLITLVVIVVLFSVVQSVRLTALIARKDTRALAAEWIEKNINPSQMVAISSAGPKFTPNKKSLEEKLSLAGPDSLGQKDGFLLSLDAEKYPQNARSIFPLWAFDKNKEKVYDFLKNRADYFVFVRSNFYPGIDWSKVPEQQAADELGKLIKTFYPASNISSRNSLSPMHIDNPIIDLWVFDKIGPFIEIYKINN